jgi:sortase A
VRRILRNASTALIIAGALLLLDAGLTVVWQEPVSALYARFEQRGLDDELQRARAAPLPVAERRALRKLPSRRHRLAFLARRHERRTAEGRALGRIRIPSIGVNFVMVQGIKPASLRKGPGHYPSTDMPGQRGTVAVAGHRTTYQAPFRRLDDLDRGDEIRLEMPYGDFTYRVERTRIVTPDALWVIRNVGHPQVVLTACHPLYSAAKRIIVFARLARTRPTSTV